VVKPASLLRKVAQVREQGYAVDREEFVEGGFGLAVPITDEMGKMVALRPASRVVGRDMRRQRDRWPVP